MLHTRILIVDDEPYAYAPLLVLLRDEGFVVEVARSAAEAFRMVAEKPPDIVLTDLQMPDMDGIGLCRALHIHSPELPVIIVTGISDTSTAVRALQAGGEDYVLKPVDFDALLMSIQRALERRAAAVERQQLRARAEELGRQALAASDAHKEILSIVAHDLRNPLGVISGWAQQLLHAEKPNALDQTSQLGLAAIARNAAHMQRLIADLLDESRLRTGRLPLESGQHLLSSILADVSELAPLAQRKRVLVDIKAPERDRAIFCDRGRINQVLGNLLINAIKFSPPGSTVTVGSEDNGAAVQFSVSDRGPGIAPDALEKIFDRFWQDEPGSHCGVGLGLYIVKGIVESHGGHVSVESRLGSGSTFFVSLPLASVDKTAVEIDVSSPATHTACR